MLFSPTLPSLWRLAQVASELPRVEVEDLAQLVVDATELAESGGLDVIVDYDGFLHDVLQAGPVAACKWREESLDRRWDFHFFEQSQVQLKKLWRRQSAEQLRTI